MNLQLWRGNDHRQLAVQPLHSLTFLFVVSFPASKANMMPGIAILKTIPDNIAMPLYSGILFAVVAVH